MKRLLALSTICLLALTMSPAQAGRTIKSKRITFEASVPCNFACPYSLGLDESDGEDFHPLDTCTNPGPAGSYDDVVVKAPRRARILIFKAYPAKPATDPIASPAGNFETGYDDCDTAVCAKPRRGNNGKFLKLSGKGAGEVETIILAVKPGRRYVLRAYNWAGLPELKAKYWFRTR